MTERLHPNIEGDPKRKLRAELHHEHLNLDLEWDHLMEEANNLDAILEDFEGQESLHGEKINSVKKRLIVIQDRLLEVVKRQHVLEIQIIDTYNQ